MPTLPHADFHLREVRPGDAEHHLALLGDPATMAALPFLNGGRRFGLQDVVARIEGQLAGVHARTLRAFGIWAGEALVGECGLKNLSVVNGSAEFGIIVAQRWWGTGAARFGTLRVLDDAFGDLGLDRVEFRTTPANGRARGLLRAMGAPLEGVLRQAIRVADGRTDEEVYSLLSSEWPEARVHLTTGDQATTRRG